MRHRHLLQPHADTTQQTAEIIALLYEATQAPMAPSTEPPALVPTGGIKSNPPANALQFQKDATRPGGGVFVATGHGPWGVALSLGTGRVVAEMVLGRKTSVDVGVLARW